MTYPDSTRGRILFRVSTHSAGGVQVEISYRRHIPSFSYHGRCLFAPGLPTKAAVLSQGFMPQDRKARAQERLIRVASPLEK